MSKVGDAYVDIHAHTKDAEKNIEKVEEKVGSLDKAINRMNNRMSVFGDSMLHADRMANSLNRRVSAGFLTGMTAALQRNENSLIALGNALEVAGSGFRKIQNESALALQGFQKFQRRGFALQATLGALAGTIGDLTGGFLTLVGLAGQAAYAFVGIGSALASVITGFLVSTIAMNGVGKALGQLWNGQNQYNRSLRDARKELKDLKFDLEGAVLSEQEAAIELEKARTQLAMAQDLPPDNMVRREAELAFQRADLNYRRAKSRVNDLQDTIKRGGNAAVRAANADPFRNLNKAQISFTKYLLTLKPQLRALKEAASSSFLPPLQTAIQTIVAKTFPTLMEGFKVIGSAMGYAANQFANIFNDPENVQALQDFFTNSGKSLMQLGDAAAKFASGFLKLLQSSQPVTDRFVTWIDSVASRFNAMADSPTFKRFLELAGYIASQIGHVFGSFGDGIKNIMEANFPSGGGGAGQVMLDWLNSIAQGFKDFTGSSEFPKWLKDTTTNATVALGIMGDFLRIFVELGGRPEIKLFWETLGKAVPDITKLLMDGLKAAPSFAAMLVSIVKLFTIFSDTGALQSFFNTLKIIADTLINLLSPFKFLIDIIGHFHGFILAIGLAILAFNGIGMVFMAILGKIAIFFGQLVTGIVKGAEAFTRFNTTVAAGDRPMVSWSRRLITFIRTLGNSNRPMNRNANNFKSMAHSMDEFGQIVAAQPTKWQRFTASLKLYKTALGSMKAPTEQHTNAMKKQNTAADASEANDKQKVVGLKAIKAAYNDTKTAIQSYINSAKAKTAVDRENNQVVKEGIATQQGIIAKLKERYNFQKVVDMNTGMGAGAGARAGGMGGVGMAMGVGFAAQGLISGAQNEGGMSAGSALTAIGGATMFVPGGMLAGLGISIVGAIIQGFEGAEKAAREKQQAIIAKNVEITAERVETRSKAALSELAALMATGNYTYQEAAQEVSDREAVARTIATDAGLADSSKLDQIRRAFVDAGIGPKTATMDAMLKAAAANLKFTRDKATAEDVSSSMLSLFSAKGKGAAGLAAVVEKFGTLPMTEGGAFAAPFAPRPAQPITAETRENLGNTGFGLSLPGQDLPSQKKAIIDLLKDPKNYTINAAQNKGGFLFDINLFNAQLLAGFDSQAINEVNNTYGKKLNGYTQEILQEAAKGLPAKFDLFVPGTEGRTRLPGLPSPTAPLSAAQAQSLYGPTSGQFNFNTGKITPGTSGFTTTDIKTLQGTATVPGIYTSVVPDLSAVAEQKEYGRKTLTALELLSGMVVEGEGLRIVDKNPRDPIPPVILPRPGAGFVEREQVRFLNDELRKAFVNGFN